MFEVGFTEIVLIFGIALLVLGPKKLPKLAADVGRWAGRARAMARQLRSQLEQEVNFDPLQDTARAAPMAAATQTIHAPPPPVETVPAATPLTPEPANVHAAATTDERQPE
jgi:Tat protein translocase TatB subunit